MGVRSSLTRRHQARDRASRATISERLARAGVLIGGVGAYWGLAPIFAALGGYDPWAVAALGVSQVALVLRLLARGREAEGVALAVTSVVALPLGLWLMELGEDHLGAQYGPGLALSVLVLACHEVFRSLAVACRPRWVFLILLDGRSPQ